NTYVTPVYTVDAALVVIADALDRLIESLREKGFRIEQQAHSNYAQGDQSDLRIQFTTDDRYQAFLSRAIPAEVLGRTVKVAALEDLVQGKLWAYGDPQRRLSKRKKDELDLIRLAEAYPHLKSLYPLPLQEMIERG
ncbi:MAG TPA: nucleotidyl transferase AbiEii/AbiGii toxin family protein, partial [Bryobacteraceae bacterium]|nr:nucleotidyl transferase AbiEii/AbiGii toxin family protein [Bryobacteraceae bacterium]